MNNKALITILVISVVINIAAAATLIFHWIRVTEFKEKFKGISPPAFQEEIVSQRRHLMELLSQEEPDSVAIDKCLDSLIELRAYYAKQKFQHISHRLRHLPPHRREKILDMIKPHPESPPGRLPEKERKIKHRETIKKYEGGRR